MGAFVVRWRKKGRKTRAFRAVQYTTQRRFQAALGFPAENAMLGRLARLGRSTAVRVG
jgi:hypothetical protein